jgi:hypothetical protein
VSTSTNWREIEQRILKVVKTSVRPVAVAFLDTEPEGVKKFIGNATFGMQLLAAGGGGTRVLHDSRKSF